MYKFLFFLPFLPITLYAQLQFNNTWIMGHGIYKPEEHFGGIQIDFNNNNLNKKTFEIQLSMSTNASISDTTGNLLFYTDGCAIANREHHVMPNGDSLNLGFWYENRCAKGSGSAYHQGTLILPSVAQKNLYYLFHLNNPNGPYTQELMYSTIDLHLDEGKGDVVEKNILLLQDTFSASMLTAVRHGNGRDWWLIQPLLNTSEYVFYLLSDKGISDPKYQKIGIPIENRSWGVQAVFSPSGKKYVNMSFYYAKGKLQIFDIDRCSGQLSNPINITFPNDEVYACGVAFSPDSRYLYASTSNSLYQFDMLAPDLDSSRILIDTFDGFDQPLATNFYMMMLAPDGKIYMGTGNGAHYYHVINEPNKPGKECDFVQRGLDLLVYNSFTVPNFPYYNLFDKADSPCDTLGINMPAPPEVVLPPPPPPPDCAATMELYPNPTLGRLHLRLPDCGGGTCNVYNVTGTWLGTMAVPGGEAGGVFDFGGYPPGVYFLVIRLDAGGVWTRRVSVVR